MNSAKKISLSAPFISNKEIRRVRKVMKSGLLAQGTEVATFENSFREIHEDLFCIAVNSGTSALHLGILGLNLGTDAEVLCPSFTFAASANAIVLAGARPIFVDVDPRTFNIDVGKLEAAITPRTKAILVVHLYGLPANMTKILEIAAKFKLKIIEDAAQAHLAQVGDKLVGTFGDVAAFSFYPTKNMTSGEGGMVVTKHAGLDEFVRKMRNQGMKVRYENDLVGFNLRMTDIHAAIGIEQLKKLPTLTQRRIENAVSLLSQIDNQEIIKPFIPEGFKHVFHQFTIRCSQRNSLTSHLQSRGIDSGIYYPIPVPYLKSFNSNKEFKVSNELSKEVLSTPVHPRLNRRELKRIAAAINDFGA